MNIDIEKERADFEAACRQHAEDAGYDDSERLERDGDGYADTHTQAAWWAWQIRAAMQSQPTEAFPCRIVEADFETGTVTLEMQGDYTVSSGQKYLCDAPLQSQDAEDAERYRWIRDEAGLMVLPYDDHGLGPEFPGGSDLDKAIDHARRIEGDSNADS